MAQIARNSTRKEQYGGAMSHLSSRHQGQQVRYLVHGVIPVGSVCSILPHCCRSRLSPGAGTGTTKAGCVSLPS